MTLARRVAERPGEAAPCPPDARSDAPTADNAGPRKNEASGDEVGRKAFYAFRTRPKATISPKPLVDVVVDVTTRSPNHHRRRGSRFVTSREVREIRTVVARVLAAKRIPTVAPLIVTLTRLSTRHLDDDNVIGAMKPVRDEVAAWLRTDDGRRSKVVAEWRCGQALARTAGVRIAIVAAPNAEPRPSPKPPAPAKPRPSKPREVRRLSDAEARRRNDIAEAKGLKAWRTNGAHALVDALEDDTDPPLWRETLFALNAKTETGRILVQRARVRDGMPSTLATELVVAHRRSSVDRWDGQRDYLSSHTRFTYRGRSRFRSRGVAWAHCEAVEVGIACLRFVVDLADLDAPARAELQVKIDAFAAQLAPLAPSSVGTPAPLRAHPVAPLPPRLVPGGYEHRETGAAVDRHGHPIARDSHRRGRSTRTTDDDEGDR